MSLQVKSYYAATVQAAMLRARDELGPDALLLHSRLTPCEAKHLGEYEVAFALGASSGSHTAQVGGGTASTRREPVHDSQGLRREVADLRREMSRIAMAIARPGWSIGESFEHSELRVLERELSDQELDQDWTNEVLQNVEGHLRPEWSTEAVREKVEQVLAQQMMTDPSLGAPQHERQVVALVGPAGAGKTTALAKLAAGYGLPARRPAQILTMDTERVAGADQLRAYAAILGMGFQMVESLHGLGQALEECRHKQFVFIDTPGFSANDAASAQEIARGLRERPEVDVHLVLPAPYRSRDLLSAFERFRIFGPRKLLFTKLDETETIGSLLNIARRTELGISFLSTGQQIPEDLIPATPTDLVSFLFGRFRANRTSGTAT